MFGTRQLMQTVWMVLVVLLLVAALSKQGHSQETQREGLKAAATAHSVTLNWTQSTSSGISGSKVYRTQGTCPGTALGTLLFSSSTPITTYTDSAVGAPGSQSCYAVTAVCASCNPTESTQSNQVSATIPADAQPAPPSGLTATPQ